MAYQSDRDYVCVNYTAQIKYADGTSLHHSDKLKTPIEERNTPSADAQAEQALRAKMHGLTVAAGAESWEAEYSGWWADEWGIWHPVID